MGTQIWQVQPVGAQKASGKSLGWEGQKRTWGTFHRLGFFLALLSVAFVFMEAPSKVYSNSGLGLMKPTLGQQLD